MYKISTHELRVIFHKITNSLNKQKWVLFFLNGYKGTCKTFILKTLATCFRSQGNIILTSTSSEIASLLLAGGRTVHSKFKILVPTLDNSTCNINGESEHAKLLRQTKLIIWDETLMAYTYTFETLDCTLIDVITKTSKLTSIFGGQVIFFLGDFCQILLVIPRGFRSDLVHTPLNSSYIWDHYEVLTLANNIRLHNGSNGTNAEEIKQISKWILKLGEGKLFEPNDGNVKIEIFP